MSEPPDFAAQAEKFDCLADPVRLRILYHAVNGPVAAPELAERDEFTISPESINYHLNKLEQCGFLDSKSVRGPGNRPRKEYVLAGDGIQLRLELIADDYDFSCREPLVR